MESRIEQALQRKHSGMNCAQAVACTYCDLAGLDETTIAAMMQGFGSGIGATMEGTCGAIVGACAIASMRNKDAGRGAAVMDSKSILKGFLEQNGSVICKELKGIGTGKVLRQCDDCVSDAARLLESVLNAKLG